MFSSLTHTFVRLSNAVMTAFVALTVPAASTGYVRGGTGQPPRVMCEHPVKDAIFAQRPYPRYVAPVSGRCQHGGKMEYG